MAVTLRDVALHAGVSPRTVSNVVNNFHYISPATRARVETSIRELNYRPNLLARSLRQGRTGIITLLLPDITVAYFSELAHEIVERASTLGYTVMIDETSGRPERESALLETIARASWVDGVLLSALGLHGKDLAALGAALPVVLLGERTAGSALDHVAIDNVAAARDAVRHLLDAGCTRVAALGGTDHRADITTRLRLKGYRQILRSAGLADRIVHAPTPDYKRSSAGPAVRSLLEHPDPPDGLFCLSDELAIGALRELHQTGLTAPQDVRVIGFDDIDEASFNTPALSSIRPDRPAIAEHALRLLISRIDGSPSEPSDVRVTHQLIARESSAQLRDTSGSVAASAPRT